MRDTENTEIEPEESILLFVLTLWPLCLRGEPYSFVTENTDGALIKLLTLDVAARGGFDDWQFAVAGYAGLDASA